MTYLDVVKWVGTVLFSIGGDGTIVLSLSGWLGKVWAERLMEKERNEHAKALESDRAKYAKELEELKAKYEHTHRRLQAELDKTIFGHQLKTQEEFKALMELGRKTQPLEGALHFLRVALLMSDTVTAEKRLKKLQEATNDLQALLSDSRPILDRDVYEKITAMISVANNEWVEAYQALKEHKDHGTLLGKVAWLGGTGSFEELGKQVYQAISDRITELSQYSGESHPVQLGE